MYLTTSVHVLVHVEEGLDGMDDGQANGRMHAIRGCERMQGCENGKLLAGEQVGAHATHVGLHCLAP